MNKKVSTYLTDLNAPDGPAYSTRFNGPNNIAIDSSGIIYVSEYNSNQIRKILPEKYRTKINSADKRKGEGHRFQL